MVDSFKFKTIPELFYQTVDKYLNDTAYKYKEGDEFVDLSYRELRKRVECFAISLMELGIHKGDRIGIVSENRMEWVIVSFAISILGAIDVPIFPILTSKQEKFIFSDSEVSAIIVSNDFQLGKVMEFKEHIPSLRHVIVMNKEFNRKYVFVKSYQDMLCHGEKLRDEKQRQMLISEFASKITPEDLLTIIYTSGTTGNPKGVMLSHKNIISNVLSSLDAYGNVEKELALSHLPLCHSYERTTGFYAMFAGGATIAIAESIESVGANIKELRPTLLITVPRLMEMIKRKVFAKMDKESSAKKKLFYWAMEVGKKHVENSFKGKKSILNSVNYQLANKLIYSKIRASLGGRLLRMISGGAALPDDVYEFFLSIGITIQQGYGLTEASPVVALNSLDSNEIGTIGKPLLGIEVKFAKDGEILVRGDNVMKGYWRNEAATREAIDKDGWLHTGDVGELSENGNIRITDRKKYIFVSSGGKNIAPQPIENLFAQSKYIDRCFLIGDSREYCTALITPDFDRLKDLADEFDIEYKNENELIANVKIINHIKKDIDYLQRDLAKFERVRRFNLLSQPFTVENGELSPKMSVKRHVVEKKYSELIDQMYKLG